MGVLVRIPGTSNDGLNFRGVEYVSDSNGKIQSFPTDLSKEEHEQLFAHGFQLEPAVAVATGQVARAEKSTAAPEVAARK